MENKQVELNVDELKAFLTHIITNNRSLQKSGKNPVSTEIVGESGLGKTSGALQLAKELGLNYIKLNLAQIEELGDLVGFPIKQFQMKKDSDIKWVDDNATEEHLRKGYEFTDEKRMSYCPPEWIAGKKGGGLLILDDWNRADIRFIQAVMELVDRQEYISWKLPEDWHIILTANPDDGTYLVNSIDKAQRTRFVSVKLKWDAKVWAAWAEKEGIDGRCINFVLLNPEVAMKSHVNPRSITTFFNCISSIEDFEKSLPLIQNIGEASVGTEFAILFTQFINNKLDKLITPHDILFHENESYIVGELRKSVGKDGSYRADIASIFTTRLVNFALIHAEKNKVEDETINRINRLATDNTLLKNDLALYVVKKLMAGNKTKFQKMLTDGTVMKMALA